MLNFILLFIFLGSFIGICFIIIRKIPILVELSPQEIENPGIFWKLKNKIKVNGFLEFFSSKEILLQRILSKFRILTLKTENKTGSWLNKLRQRSLEKKKCFPDDYWKGLKRKK